MRVKLEDVCIRGSSNLRQKDIENITGDHPIYGASGYIGNADFYHQENEYVAVVKDGAGIGRTMLLPGRSSVIGTMQYLIPKDNILPKYLYYVVRHMHLEKYFSGATIPHIYFKDYKNEEFDLASPDKQKYIVDVLDKVENIIEKRDCELKKLDSLIKARFVEMFGDPVSNPYKWEKVFLSELADIKIGPFGSLLHKSDYIENGHPLVNPSHIKNGKIIIDDKFTISNKKFEEMSAFQLQIGDVVLGRRGEMGRCAVVSKNGLLCGTGSLFIRSKGEVTSDHIQKIISFPSFKKVIEDMAVGQTMSNLNVPIVSNFEIIKPPIKVQHDYHSSIHQIDKLGSVVQKALDKTQLLLDSLMQKFFDQDQT